MKIVGTDRLQVKMILMRNKKIQNLLILEFKETSEDLIEAHKKNF